jgi:hypothetical protein
MKLRAWLTHAALLVSALSLPLGLFQILNADTPLLESVLIRYAAAAAVAMLFTAAALSAGLTLVRYLMPGRLRWEERLALAFPCGALCFQLGTFALGALGALNRPAGLLLPCVLLAAGGRSAWRLLRRVSSIPRPLARGVRQPVLLSCLGALTLAYLTAHTLTSDSIGYDSSWYHLPIAEAYAASGSIRAFRDGWLLGSYPQLASILYAWALVVTRDSALGLTAAALIELTFVLSACFTIVPLTRCLLGGPRRQHWAWTTIALFPAVLLYPPRIEGDYVAAAFAAPLLLCAFKIWERPERRSVALGALLLGGVLLVKYSAIGASVLPLGIACAGLLRQLWAARRSDLVGELKRTGQTLGIAALTFLGITSTHWLKNLVFYGDPVFPSHTPTSAFTPITHAFYQAILKTLWVPAPGAKGWEETFSALFSFSFKPHEYPEYNAGHPIFGSLFSLTLLPLLLLFPLRRGRRALVAHLGTLLGVLVWYRVHHQDRYLLAFLPWMCAVTAATLAELWRQRLARPLLALVCALQFVWGARWAAKLFPLDSLRGRLWATSAEAWDQLQLSRWQVMQRIGEQLPRDAVLLVHDERIRLGLRRTSVSDSLGFETRLSYADLGRDDLIFDRLRSVGVTHLYGPRQSAGFQSLADDLLFYGFYQRHGVSGADPDLRAMPRARPPAVPADQRLVFMDVCGAVRIPQALYRVTELVEVTFGMPSYLQARPLAVADDRQQAEALLDRAEFLVQANSCHRGSVSAKAFERLATRNGYGLFQRR